MVNTMQKLPLQVYPSKDFSGLSETNNIANLYATEPEKIGSVLAFAFGYQANNVLSLLTGGLGNTLYVGNREYEWGLHGQSDKSIDILEDTSGGNATPGLGGQPFTLTFVEKWFDASDDLRADDDMTSVHVISEGYQSGEGYTYSVVMNGGDLSAFCDPSLMKPGAKWSKLFSSVDEGSTKGGGNGFMAPSLLRNQLTTLRKTYKVTREAALTVMIIELYDPSDPTKSTKMWTKLAEWTHMAHWYREIDRSMIYSKYNKNAQGFVPTQGEGKRPVYHGAGFQEQIAPANKRPYTKLTYELLHETLLDLSFSASKWGGDYKFVALTGKMGMQEFDRAIKEYAKGNNITVTNSGTFITGNGSELTLDGHFSTVKFMNGIELTVKEFEPYNDTTLNKLLHPISKKPLESYRFTILNFGRKDGKSNIRKVCLKGSEMAMWHVKGSVDPYGLVSSSISTSGASGFDGYDVHFLTQCGIMVEDPTSCAELYMRVI